MVDPSSEPFYYFHPADNIAPAATVTTSGTVDSAYPVTYATNVTPAYLAAPSKILETSGTWLGDHGSVKRMDVVVLWINGDENLEVFFEANATNAWTSPTILTSVIMPAKRADGFVFKVMIDLRRVSGYSTGGFRYFRIRVASANSAALGLKFLIFSRVRQLPDDFQWGVVDDEHQVGIAMQTDGGSRWGYDLASAPRSRRGSVLKTDAAAELLREWFRAAAGGTTLVAMVPEPSENDVWLGFLMVDTVGPQSPSVVIYRLSNTRDYTNINRLAVTFTEAAHGAPEWD